MTHDPTTTNTTSTTTTTTEHYSISTNQPARPRTRATRSKDSHPCITIRRWRPAFGRPYAPLRADRTRVDLCKINNADEVATWS